MNVIRDMKPMSLRVVLAFTLSAGLTLVGGCKSAPPAATPTGIAAGATTNPDGSVTNPDGSVTYPPGSAQASAAQGIKNADGSVTNGNGSVTYPKGSPQAKSEPPAVGAGGATPAAQYPGAQGSGAPAPSPEGAAPAPPPLPPEPPKIRAYPAVPVCRYQCPRRSARARTMSVTASVACSPLRFGLRTVRYCFRGERRWRVR